MTATCDECGREFKNERGVNIHKGSTHDKPTPIIGEPRKAAAKERVPPIVRREVEAGLEVAEGYLHRAETAETDREREQFRQLVRFQLRAVKNSV